MTSDWLLIIKRGSEDAKCHFPVLWIPRSRASSEASFVLFQGTTEQKCRADSWITNRMIQTTPKCCKPSRTPCLDPPASRNLNADFSSVYREEASAEGDYMRDLPNGPMWYPTSCYLSSQQMHRSSLQFVLRSNSKQTPLESRLKDRHFSHA